LHADPREGRGDNLDTGHLTLQSIEVTDPSATAEVWERLDPAASVGFVLYLENSVAA